MSDRTLTQPTPTQASAPTSASGLGVRSPVQVPASFPAGASAPSEPAIFISPRVVDRQAFADFAGELRALIREAGEHATSLRDAAQRARAEREDSASATSKLQPRIESAARLAMTLEERTASARQTLTRLGESGDLLKQFEQGATPAIEKALAALVKKGESLVADSEQQAKALEERSAKLVADACAKIADAERAALDRVKAAEVTSVKGILAARVAAQTEVMKSVTKSEQARKALEEAVDQLEARAGKVMSESEPIVQRLRDELARALTVLGFDPSRAAGDADATTALSPARDSLCEVVQRAESVADSALFAVKQFESVKSQTDRARTLLGQSLVEATAAIDRLADCAAALASQADSAVARLQGHAAPRPQPVRHT